MTSPPVSPRSLKFVQGGLEKGEAGFFKASQDNVIAKENQINAAGSKIVPSFQGIPSLTPPPPEEGIILARSGTPTASAKFQTSGVDDSHITEADSKKGRRRASTAKRVQFNDQPIVVACPMDQRSQVARRRSASIEKNLENFDLIERQLEFIDEEIAREERLEKRKKWNPIFWLKDRVLMANG